MNAFPKIGEVILDGLEPVMSLGEVLASKELSCENAGPVEDVEEGLRIGGIGGEAGLDLGRR